MTKVFKVGIVAPTYSGISYTANSTGFSLAGGTTSKTLTISNTLTLAGTDSTTFTFPATSDTLAGLATTQTFTGANTIAPSSTSIIPLVINAPSGQSVDILDVNLNGVKRLFVDSGGLTHINQIAAIGGSTARIDLSGTTVGLNSSGATNFAVVIKGFASQTADLTQWQDSAATVLAKIDSSGNLYAPTLQSTTASTATLTTNGDTGGLLIQTGADANKGLAIKGNSGTQSGDLFTIQDNTLNYYIRVLAGGRTGIYATNPALNVLFVRGAITQTNDLQQWQSSAATVLAKIDSAGNLFAPTLQSTTASTATLTTNADTGGIRIDTGGTGNKGLVIKFVGSATVNPFEVQNVSGTPVLYVDNNGKVNANASFSAGTVSSSVTVATLTGASGQTSDLLALRNSSGTVLSRINSVGQWQAPQPALQGLIVKAATTITNASVTSAVGSGSATVFTYTSTSQLFTVGQSVTTTGFTPAGYNATGAITAIGTVTAGTTYTFTTANTTTGTSSGTGTATVAQSANLQEWQDTAGAILGYVSNNGSISQSNVNGTLVNLGWAGFGGNAIGGTNGISVYAVSKTATSNAMVARGYTSQTADLQQWQNSSSTVLAKIDASGNLYAPTLQSTTSSTATLTTNGDTGGLLIGTVATGNKGLVINAVASQVANIFEVQANASAKVIVDFTGAMGIFTAPLNNHATLSLGARSTSVPQFVIQAAASQTADMIQIQDSTSTLLMRVNAAGQIQAPQPAKQGLIVKAATTLTATITNAVGSAGTVTYTATNTFTAGQTVTITGVTPSAYNLSSVTIATASASQFTVTNAATGTYVSGGTATVAQSANLQEWQTSAGSVVTYINASGYLIIGAGGASGVGILVGNANFTGVAYNGISNPNGATTLPSLVVKAITSQTADLQQWHDASGNVLLNVNASGALGTPATAVTSTNSNAVSIQTGNATGTTSNSGSITIDAGTATGTTGSISIGTANASSVTIGKVGGTTTINGLSLPASSITLTMLADEVKIMNIMGAF